ncbi:hypothetical protein G7Y89_g15688 [Cudoniella acicularis]|uniref:Heterokaryon incompatibility domain-containing protein n=1 Tax=Cudoniella acicularis TaxID=354080 RepID=A0A8H4VKJ1_9HELO|nr:hypothetical protein G7Y89_g15688 [Cudoniella acicularis]
MICDICRNLRSDMFEAEVVHIVSRKDLIKSAEAGCKTCIFIREARKAAATNFANPLSIEKPMLLLTKNAENSLIQIQSSHNSSNTWSLDAGQLEVFAHYSDNAQAAWPGVGVAGNVSENNLSDEALALAAHWLQSCIKSHPNCGSASKKRLPKRVLGLSATGNQIRLYETKHASEIYATLSHCWVSVRPLTTETSTLEERKAGIPVFSLPQSFQDAVRVTRKLGIPYLWIDSLCILQDSPKNWQEESAAMQEVYSEAIVNIAANTASDSTQGLGTIRTNSLRAEQVGKPRKGIRLWFRRSSENTPSGKAHRPIWCQWNEEPLRTRAWVFQESILSPRILHFSAFELAWECSGGLRCQCTLGERQVAGWHLSPHPKLESVENSTETWSRLVTAYSNLSLTFEADKLNAIAGLASRIAQSNKKKYVAVLWVEGLPYCLYWNISYGSKVRRITGEFPSWSWASVVGTISIGYNGQHLKSPHEMNLQAKNIEFEHAIDGIPSKSQNGVLEASCYLSKVTVKKGYVVTPVGLEDVLVSPDMGNYSEFRDRDIYAIIAFLDFLHGGYIRPGNRVLCLLLRPFSRALGEGHYFKRIGRCNFPLSAFDEESALKSQFKRTDIRLV